MGYDKTPSRNKMILGMALLCIGSLIALMPLFRMYFFHVVTPMQEALAAEAGLAQVQGYRAEQQAALQRASSAVEQFGQAGRGANPAIAPRRSDSANVDAVEGWTLMKDEAAAAHARYAFEAARAREAAAVLAAQTDGGVPAEPTRPVAPSPGVAPAPTPAP